MPSRSAVPTTVQKNIDAVARVEQALLRKRSLGERLGEGVARFFGSVLFIAAHAAFFAAWIAINAGSLAAEHPFDPYPFGFLSLIVGVEFIFLTTFVLLNQKHQMRRADQWSHLQLQLSLLTEQEMTKNLEMLSRVCRHLGLERPARDVDLAELTQPTSVTDVVGEIERSRDTPAPPAEPADDTTAATPRGRLDARHHPARSHPEPPPDTPAHGPGANTSAQALRFALTIRRCAGRARSR